MMTSTPVTKQQQTEGRTVREVVEFNQDLVNEVWCRRVFRQVLQSVELQYAMQMPHRPISPDTVLILDSGDPMLLPVPESDAPWSEAGDMHDLAAVVHYAITRENPPAAPLLGRAPGEYGDSFLAAVDRCLSPDPQLRPQTIEQLRNLLGIVPLGPAVPGQSFEAFQAASAKPVVAATAEPEPALPEKPAAATERGRLQRWLMLVAAATVLLAALGALFALLHQADSRDTVNLALPADEAPAQVAPATPIPPAPAPAAVGAAPGSTPLPDASLPMPLEPGQVQPPTAPPPAIITLPPDTQAARLRQAAAAAAGGTYKLLIKPWGSIEVNGAHIGVSPPLKRLHLAPGQHTIRIANPNFREHLVTVNAVKGGSSVIELDFTEEDTE